MRNDSMTGTISALRYEYFESAQWSKNDQVWHFELIPKDIRNMNAAPGQQKRLHCLDRIMQKSHIKFYAEGTKVQMFSQKECNFLIMFPELKEVSHVESTFLFAQPREHSTLIYGVQKQRMKQRSRDILRVLGFRDKIVWNGLIH